MRIRIGFLKLLNRPLEPSGYKLLSYKSYDKWPARGDQIFPHNLLPLTFYAEKASLEDISVEEYAKLHEKGQCWVFLKMCVGNVLFLGGNV